MVRTAVIDKTTMKVINVVMCNSSLLGGLDPDMLYIASDTANIGDDYDTYTGKFTRTDHTPSASKDYLRAYANSVLYTKQNMVIVVSIPPDMLHVDTDASGVAAVMLLLRQTDNGADVTWVEEDKVVILSPIQLHVIYYNICTYMQNVIQKWKDVISGINLGTITTTDGVDNPSPPWPSTTY
jgi:hypothetical protein